VSQSTTQAKPVLRKATPAPKPQAAPNPLMDALFQLRQGAIIQQRAVERIIEHLTDCVARKPESG
jgi:hypothetical protein